MPSPHAATMRVELENMKKSLITSWNDSDGENVEVFKYGSRLLRALLRKRDGLDDGTLLLVLECMTLLFKNGRTLELSEDVPNIYTEIICVFNSPNDVGVIHGSECVILASLECLKQCFDCFHSFDWLLCANAPFIAHFIFVFLQLLKSESSSLGVKRLALDNLERLCASTTSAAGWRRNSSDCLAAVFPGLSINLVTASLKDSVHHSIASRCFCLWTHVIKVLFSDSGTAMDLEWRESCAEKLLRLVRKAAAALVSHPHPLVRRAVVQWALSLLDCRSSLSCCVPAVMAVLSVLDEDTTDVVERLRADPDIWSSLYLPSLEQLIFELSSSLPLTVREKTESEAERALCQMSGALRLLGVDGFRRFCLSSSLSTRLLIALRQSLEIDVKRLSLVSMEDSSDAFLLPFKNLKCLNVIENICETVGSYAEDSVLYSVLETVQNSPAPEQPQAVLLMNSILNASKGNEESGEGIAEDMLDLYLDLLAELRLETESPSKSSATAIQLTRGITVCCRKLTERTRERQLPRCLCPLMELVACGQSAVSAAAHSALSILASTAGAASSQMLFLSQADFLVHVLCVQLRHFGSYPRAPLLLGVFLRFGCRDLLPQLRRLSSDVLRLVDATGELPLILLRCLVDMVTAISDWFPSPSPGPPPSEPRDPLPVHVDISADILRRTKHLLSSDVLAHRMLLLDLFHSCLMCVSGVEDVLLPMIHQNWPGVVARLSDKETVVAVKAVQVIFRMAELSRDFMYRRVVDEFLPRISEFLRRQAKDSRRSGGVYSGSAAFKLQIVLLSGFPALMKNIGAVQETDLTVVRELCEIFCCPSQPAALRQLAHSSLQSLSGISSSSDS